MSLLACLLSYTRIKNHELMVWLCNSMDSLHLVYQVCFKGVPACSVHYFYIVFFKGFKPVSGNLNSIRVSFFPIKSDIEFFTKSFKLVVSSRTESICSNNSCFESFSLEVTGKFCSTCSFS